MITSVNRTIHSRNLIAVTAAAGGLLGIALTLPFAYASYLNTGGPTPWWRPPVEAVFPFQFGSVATVYRSYGRIYLLPMLLELWAFYALRGFMESKGIGFDRLGLRLVTYGIWLATVGVLTDYWTGTPPAFYGAMLGAVLMLAGLICLAVRGWRSRKQSGWVVAATLAILPAEVASLAFVHGHVPSGPLLPFHVLWLATAMVLLLGKAGVRRMPT